jgi:hypothetical protein
MRTGAGASRTRTDPLAAYQGCGKFEDQPGPAAECAVPCPVPIGAGDWDSAECVVERLGRAWVQPERRR